MYDLKPPKLTYLTGVCNNPHGCDSTELVKEGQETWCRKCCWRQGTKRLAHRTAKQQAAYERYRERERLKRRRNPVALCRCGCGREISVRGNLKYATKECQHKAQNEHRRQKARAVREMKADRMGVAV